MICYTLCESSKHIGLQNQAERKSEKEMYTYRQMSVECDASIVRCQAHSLIHKPTPPSKLYHSIAHFRSLTTLPHRPFILSLRASEKTSLTPNPVLAEHSIYFAPISLATACPCSAVTGDCPCAASMRRVCSSVRRSILVATSISGTDSQKWETSGYH